MKNMKNTAVAVFAILLKLAALPAACEAWMYKNELITHSGGQVSNDTLHRSSYNSLAAAPPVLPTVYIHGEENVSGMIMQPGVGQGQRYQTVLLRQNLRLVRNGSIPQYHAAVFDARKLPQRHAKVPDARKLPQRHATVPDARKLPQRHATVPDARKLPKRHATVSDARKLSQRRSLVSDVRKLSQRHSTVSEARKLPQRHATVSDARKTPRRHATVSDARKLPQRHATVSDARKLSQRRSLVSDVRKLSQRHSTVSEARKLPQRHATVSDARKIPQRHATVSDARKLPQLHATVSDARQLSQRRFLVSDARKLSQRHSTVSEARKLPQRHATVSDVRKIPQRHATVSDARKLPQRHATVSDARKLSQRRASVSDSRKLNPATTKNHTLPPTRVDDNPVAALEQSRHGSVTTELRLQNNISTSLSRSATGLEPPGTSTFIETPKLLRTREPAKVPHAPGTPNPKGTQDSSFNALSTSIGISMEISQTTGEGTTPKKDEVHVHFGTRETVRCIRESMYEAGSNPMENTYRHDHHSATNNPVYMEIHAAKGSIVGRLDTDKVRNISDSFNKANLKCKVSPMHVYYPASGEHCCALRVHVPAGLYVAVEILKHAGAPLVLYEPGLVKEVSKDFTVTEDNEEDTRVFVGSSNVVNILQIVQLRKPYPEDQFFLRFQGLRKPGLQVRRTAANRGVVETPLHHGHTLLLKPLADPWAAVHVPSEHVIMVSSPDYEMLKRCVALYAGDRGNETLAEICRGDHNPPRATIYNTSLLLVHIYRDFYNRQEGFRLYFSVHNDSALPTRLSNDSWDCSVPYASDFMYHLSCNLAVECHDIADEMNCSYTSDLCGPGYLTLGGACFFYLRRQQDKITWITASEMCAQREGKLASLNSGPKWDNAVRVLLTSNCREENVFVGITTGSHNVPPWYGAAYQWSDETIGLTNLNLPIEVVTDDVFTLDCNNIRKRIGGYLRLTADCIKKLNSLVLSANRDKLVRANVLCEKPFTLDSAAAAQRTIRLNSNSDRWSRDAGAYVKCPLGHYTHQFLACDVRSLCWREDHSSRCESPRRELLLSPPTFKCANGVEHMPYTLVCDYRMDCVDGSDEQFCHVSRCQSDEFRCDNKQCIPNTKVRDGWEDCHNGEEEINFLREPVLKGENYQARSSFVSLSTETGMLSFQPLQEKGACQDTHFRCLDDGNCLPVFMRCNGIYECPGHEDETGCDACPGFYRCRNSQVCLHRNDLCDGRAICPQHDDELMCNTTCPNSCVCWGLAFRCRHNFTFSSYPLLRYLDASGSAVTTARLRGNHLLIHLVLAECGLESVADLVLRNLLILDIRDNQLSAMSGINLDGVPQLRELTLAGNPLMRVFEGLERISSLRHILNLDLSRVIVPVLNVSALSAFTKLEVLNLSYSGLQRVHGETLKTVDQLRVIDLRGCPVTWFPRDLFRGLKHLQLVHADNFKLCCPAVLPKEFSSRNCFAPGNKISSCDNLLRRKAYTVYVFALSLLATTGNIVSFIFRSFVSTWENKLGCQNLVTHLSVSDFLMGMYLAVIGVADQLYHGAYLWNDEAWRHGSVCKFAGFLSLLSSEVSALIMCLITADRFITLHFPFTRLRFTPASSHAAMVVVWAAGVLVAFVPLLPVTARWEFYSQSGICIPFPVNSEQFPGHSYSFSILVVFNLAIFIFIGIIQLSIYFMPVFPTAKQNNDLVFARRLVSVAMTDFLCWFSIDVLGLLIANDIPVSGDISAALAIFVLPLNSAVNPCLYTFSVITERRNRAREEKLQALLLAQLRARS